jgi:serine/threonine protein kinase
MSHTPDFSDQCYQVVQELGRNREAGRITYLAIDLNLNKQVVIKEFRFALAEANWSGFKAYEREIKILQQLDHPRIPHYLNCFETSQGFCLVQEYKKAVSLAERYSFTPEEIKKIAISVLKILAYLQQRTPAILHRDIKPENILVDKHCNAYLVDFGLARLDSKEVALSSIIAGTPGFIPPEAQLGRPQTEASDLYSLGVTLICLLSGIPSSAVWQLIDEHHCFNLKHLSPKLNRHFIQWLQKMVANSPKNRYINAAVALEFLLPISVIKHTKFWDIKLFKHTLKLSQRERKIQRIGLGIVFWVIIIWGGLKMMIETKVDQANLLEPLNPITVKETDKVVTKIPLAEFLGSLPYLSFANSPFSNKKFRYFHLENFEDRLLNTPGVTVSSGQIVGPEEPWALTDSVDADDGNKDGSGFKGHSLYGDGTKGFTFTFDAKSLGQLPTHVGIVWTDGPTSTLVTFEAFDSTGQSLGTVSGSDFSDINETRTFEDRFFGIIHTGGISSIKIVSPPNPGTSGYGIEVDHLQYGKTF